MRILFTGGRDYLDAATVDQVLSPLLAEYGDSLICIAGGQRGLDTLVEDWCRLHDVDFIRVPGKFKKYHKAAGDIRNNRMLFVFQPERVIAFPGGPGTRNMKKLAREFGIEPEVINGSL